jgi:hypothetical protein
MLGSSKKSISSISYYTNTINVEEEEMKRKLLDS